jgi:DNA-binding GntR family transcriptional regulator
MRSGQPSGFDPSYLESLSEMVTLTSADIQFSSRVEQTAAVIKNAILEGRLKAGDRIGEANIAATLRIGQPTVREALIQLQHTGFLVRIPHRGTFVVRLTDEQAAETYRVREYLELLAVKLARGRVTEEGLERVRTYLAAMEDAAVRGDKIAYYEADLAFHRALWQLSGNRCLANLLELLTGPVLVVGNAFSLRRNDDTNRSSLAWHQRMANCLTEGTEEEVEQTLREAYAEFLAQYRREAAQARDGIAKDGAAPRGAEGHRNAAESSRRDGGQNLVPRKIPTSKVKERSEARNRREGAARQGRILA